MSRFNIQSTSQKLQQWFSKTIQFIVKKLKTLVHFEEIRFKQSKRHYEDDTQKGINFHKDEIVTETVKTVKRGWINGSAV